MTLAPFCLVVVIAFLGSWACVWPALRLLRFVPAARQTLVWAVYLGCLLCWLPLLACCLLLPNAHRDPFAASTLAALVLNPVLVLFSCRLPGPQRHRWLQLL
jgi:hypothetical protein